MEEALRGDSVHGGTKACKTGENRLADNIDR